MAEARLSLSWDTHQKSICNGLGLLQQRGEFVDMTLAADGHYVKVHQMVMSLVSPYIKELISTAPCPHPIIFLNNISSSTLSALLEYAYTGQVLVAREDLTDLITAGRVLHIKGLMEMVPPSVSNNIQSTEPTYPISEISTSTAVNTLVNKLQEIKENKKHNVKFKEPPEASEPVCKVFIDTDGEIDEGQYMHAAPTKKEDRILMDMDSEMNDVQNISVDTVNKKDVPANLSNPNIVIKERLHSKTKTKPISTSEGNGYHIQYSVSNQGGLQIILNRYIYSLKYVQKNMLRFWRCVDSSSKRCPANVYMNAKNEIVRRTFTHNHPFHDEKIVKKIRRNVVFAAYNEAKSAAEYKKAIIKENESPPSEDLKRNTEPE